MRYPTCAHIGYIIAYVMIFDQVRHRVLLWVGGVSFKSIIPVLFSHSDPLRRRVTTTLFLSTLQLLRFRVSQYTPP